MMLLLMRTIISSTTVSSWPADGMVWANSQGAPTNVASSRTANLFIKYLTRRSRKRAASPEDQNRFRSSYSTASGHVLLARGGGENCGSRRPAPGANLARRLGGLRDSVRQAGYGLQLSWMLNDFMAGDGAGPTITLSGAQPNHWYNSDQWIYWTMTDSSGNGHLPSGVAGSSYYWDVDPGDAYSEPTPSTQPPWYWTNSFYLGPIDPNSSNGSVDLFLMPNGQGCHALFVRAWDNTGRSSVASPSGPMCLDFYPPITNIALTGNLQGGQYVGSVLVTLNAYDPGYPGSFSGVASTLYNINGGSWQTYSGPFYVTTPGIYVVAYYSTDNAGNVETTQYADFIIAYNWQVLLSVSKAGAGSGTVTSADGYINCGSTCSYSYWAWEQVTLTKLASC